MAKQNNPLGVYETQRAIKSIKETMERRLSHKLSLLRVSAPLFLPKDSGLNDGLSGIEVPVSFLPRSVNKTQEVVQSLAKWKRYALGRYEVPLGQGIYADMNAIRPDEDIDALHSLYVDQWDWEVRIKESDRNVSYLKKTVRKVYAAIRDVALSIEKRYPQYPCFLPSSIHFLTSEELEKRYPKLDRKKREDAICKEYGAVFLMRIGWPLSDGKPHDSRAADYDDWNLNGDILVHNPVLDSAFELSSMGIRVDEVSLLAQLKAKGEEDKIHNFYCQAILNHKIPLSIGGGIGQSRLCMLLLRKSHIGEVQVSSWNEESAASLKEKGITLL